MFRQRYVSLFFRKPTFGIDRILTFTGQALRSPPTTCWPTSASSSRRLLLRLQTGMLNSRRPPPMRLLMVQSCLHSPARRGEMLDRHAHVLSLNQVANKLGHKQSTTTMSSPTRTQHRVHRQTSRGSLLLRCSTLAHSHSPRHSLTTMSGTTRKRQAATARSTTTRRATSTHQH